VPYYIIPFDKRGLCEGPETLKHLIDGAKQGDYSDIFLFSHGWNNDWKAATGRYEHFITGYMNMRREHGLPVPVRYRPLLVGVFWPSAVLVSEAEVGPDIAAGDPAAMDDAVAEERIQVRELAAELPADRAERFYELTQKDSLDEQEALELAGIARVFYGDEDEELQLGAPASAEEIVNIWAKASPEPTSPFDFSTVDASATAEPRAALFGGLFQKLRPRNIARTLSVYQMKDRAGRVGAHGVGPLLRRLLETSDARVHLLGHSYGAKVVLAAASSGGDLPRKVDSMLLLQAAVSHLCFAEKLPGTGRAGGYRNVLNRVNKPILSTFSANDRALTKEFHLFLRRDDDVGEVQIAAAGEPPNKYAALGGFGPRGCGEKLIDIKNVNQPYDLDPGTKIYGLRGTRTISSHGGISNESTWWALYSLVSS
jgi:hypothetical protein